MMSQLEEEKYYYRVYERFQKKSDHCDEITVLAHELNNLFHQLKKIDEADPAYNDYWNRIVISTNFLLALYHENRSYCF